MKLEVRNLTKSFEDNQVLHGVSFEVESGSALGLLGRNGAGKTTTIRIIMDVFKADLGEEICKMEKLENAGKQFDSETMTRYNASRDYIALYLAREQ